MPAFDIAITAAYLDIHTLTVTSGSGSGSSYTNGQQVAVAASNLSGKVFDRWTGATQYVASVTSPSTTVTMPAFDIAITATYLDAKYTLTVSGGGGGGSYTNGQQVAVAANVLTDRTFDRWTGATQYVASVTSPNTTVTMPAADISITATYTMITSALPENRILLFEDYALTNNAPTPTWVHEGPAFGSVSPNTKALLVGTNHYHRTGWVLRSCRTGCSGYIQNARIIPPMFPSVVPTYPVASSNLAANLRNESGAMIESPVFTNGIGTIYFDAINELQSNPTELTVDIATNMVNPDLGTVIGTVNPASTNGLNYVWESVSVLTLNAATSNDFIRFSKVLNYHQPIKMRIRRTSAVADGVTADNALTVIDSIRVSIPPADVAIAKTDLPFEPGYPSIGTNVTVRCYVSNVDTNMLTDSRKVKVIYRWRYLNQMIGSWRTNDMSYVAGTGDGAGNGTGNRYEASLPSFADGGDLEYYFTCDFSGYLYLSPDYTGTGLNGYPYPTEALTPRKLQGSGTEFSVRLRPYTSKYAALYAETDQHADPIAMTLTGDNEWRAMVPVEVPSVTNLTWRFKGVGEYTAGTGVASTGVTYWAGLGDVAGGSVPYGGVCVATNSSGRLSVSINSGAYAMLTFNTDRLQYMANRAEYQNFNFWPAPLSTFTESNGQVEKQYFLNTFDSWPTNVDETYQEMFNSTNVVTGVYYLTPFDTIGFWKAGSAKYVSERAFDSNPLALFNAHNLALRLKGGDPDLGLGYINNTLINLPDGLKKVDFKARLGQTASNYDVVYYRNGFANANYLVRATIKADPSTISPETPSLSLVAYYRDPGNFYEFRTTQVVNPAGTPASPQDLRANYRLYKWVNGTASLLAEASATLSSAPMTIVGDTAQAEMRLYNTSGSATLIRCKFANYDNVLVYTDNASLQYGTYGFLSAECKAGLSNVGVGATTTDAVLSGSVATMLPPSGTFDADVASWYYPTNKYRAVNSASPMGIYSVIPSQSLGVYGQNTVYVNGVAQEQSGSDWKLLTQVTVTNFMYQASSVTINSWQSQYVKLQVMGGSADVAVDDIGVYSWHGKFVPAGAASKDWQGTEAWVVSNSTSEANIVQLDHSRGDPSLKQAVRSLLLTNGMGVIEFDYRVIRPPAKITVQYAYQSAANTWIDVSSFVVSNGVTWTHTSAYLGISDPGYFRVLNERSGGYTNAWIDINNVTVWDEPYVTNTAWKVYNAKITQTDTMRLLLDQSKACYLNNSTTNETAPPQTFFEPYLKSPQLPKGFGTLSFYARAYTNTQATAVYVYATTVSWNAPTNQWFELCRFENITNTLYQLYTFSPPGGRSDIKAIKLSTKISGVAGRACLEEVSVAEPVLPGFDIVNVKLLLLNNGGSYSEHPQPLAGEDIHVEARIANQQLVPSNIVMYMSYYVGTNVWGVGNWPVQKTVTRRMHPVDGDPTRYRTREDNGNVIGLPAEQIGGIREQDSDAVVQYYVGSTYLGGVPLVRKQDTFVNPTWYYPVDLNVAFLGQGWSPYYFVYNVPLNSVWINEVNAVDYVADGNGDQVYGIWNNQYIEIAVPAWLDLAGWSVDLVTSANYVTDTIKIPSGLPAQVAYTNGYAFFVIGDAFDTEGVPALPKKDYGYLGLNGKMPNTLPGGLRLRRPLGMYEQTIAYDWNPAYGTSFSGVRWAANDPQGRFVYVGRENNGGSLGRIGTNNMSTVDSTNTWFFPQVWTPGSPNGGQVISDNGDKLQPGVSNVWLTAAMSLLKGSQNGKRTASFALKMRVGDSTNIVYQIDDWYRLYSLQVNSAQQLTSGESLEGLRSYDLQLLNLQSDVNVNAGVQLRKDLATYENDTTVLNWILGFQDGVLVPSYYNNRLLTMTEQYWLDANPTVTNQFQFSITKLSLDSGTNFHVTVEMDMNGGKQTHLMGEAVLKLQAKNSLLDNEWVLLEQYSLSAASFDVNNTCRAFVPNPFAILLAGKDPQHLFFRWVIEMKDPRVGVEVLVNDLD